MTAGQPSLMTGLALVLHPRKGRLGRPFCLADRLCTNPLSSCEPLHMRAAACGTSRPWLGHTAWFVTDGVPMKSRMCVLTGVVALSGALVWPVAAQERIYRCGNEYTNNPDQARLKNCRPLDGANLTVVQGTRPAVTAADRTPPSTPARAKPASASADAPRAPVADPTAQRARESDARAILEAELRRAEDALAQAKQAYAGGQPEKQGPEFRNHQLYLDRVAQMQAAVQRAEADVASIKRELSRLAPPGR